MSGKLRVLISAILLTPAAALGLGLGEIRLNSSLNEPLSAEIDLVAATPEELAALDAQPRLAGSLRALRARPSGIPELARIHRRPRTGRTHVPPRRSRDAISEPFVSFLIDVNWPRGRLLREYTVLLDPPAMLAAGDSPAAAPIAAPTTAPQQPAAPHADRAGPRPRLLRRRRRPQAARAGDSRRATDRLTRSRAATRSTALRARLGRRPPGDPAHDDRAVPRESRSLQRQHQPAACGRDPAHADLGRDRGHLVRRGGERSGQQNAAWRAAGGGQSPAG